MASCFITSATDGSGRSIRTLLQSDGDIVTRASADSIGDRDLLARHLREISLWLERVNHKWASIENMLSGGATVLGVALLGTDLTAPYHGAAGVFYVLVPLVPLLGRGALAGLVRRRLLRAV